MHPASPGMPVPRGTGTAGLGEPDGGMTNPRGTHPCQEQVQAHLPGAKATTSLSSASNQSARSATVDGDSDDCMSPSLSDTEYVNDKQNGPTPLAQASSVKQSVSAQAPGLNAQASGTLSQADTDPELTQTQPQDSDSEDGDSASASHGAPFSFGQSFQGLDNSMAREKDPSTTASDLPDHSALVVPVSTVPVNRMGTGLSGLDGIGNETNAGQKQFSEPPVFQTASTVLLDRQRAGGWLLSGASMASSGHQERALFGASAEDSMMPLPQREPSHSRRHARHHDRHELRDSLRPEGVPQDVNSDTFYESPRPEDQWPPAAHAEMELGPVDNVASPARAVSPRESATPSPPPAEKAPVLPPAGAPAFGANAADDRAITAANDLPAIDASASQSGVPLVGTQPGGAALVQPLTGANEGVALQPAVAMVPPDGPDVNAAAVPSQSLDELLEEMQNASPDNALLAKDFLPVFQAMLEQNTTNVFRMFKESQTTDGAVAAQSNLDAANMMKQLKLPSPVQNVLQTAIRNHSGLSNKLAKVQDRVQKFTAVRDAYEQQKQMGDFPKFSKQALHPRSLTVTVPALLSSELPKDSDLIGALNAKLKTQQIALQHELNGAAVELVIAEAASASAKVLAVRSQLERSIDYLVSGSAQSDLAASQKLRALTDFDTAIQNRQHRDAVAASDKAAMVKDKSAQILQQREKINLSKQSDTERDKNLVALLAQLTRQHDQTGRQQGNHQRLSSLEAEIVKVQQQLNEMSKNSAGKTDSTSRSDNSSRRSVSTKRKAGEEPDTAALHWPASGNDLQDVVEFTSDTPHFSQGEQPRRPRSKKPRPAPPEPMQSSRPDQRGKGQGQHPHRDQSGRGRGNGKGGKGKIPRKGKGKESQGQDMRNKRGNPDRRYRR